MIIVTRSITQKINPKGIFKIPPRMLPLENLTTMPKIQLVNGIIAKIKLIIQGKPKYALFDFLLAIFPLLSILRY